MNCVIHILHSILSVVERNSKNVCVCVCVCGGGGGGGRGVSRYFVVWVARYFVVLF